MSSIEKLHFKIGIGATYWKKVPTYSILINDHAIFTKNKIETASGDVGYVEFDVDVSEGPFALHIRLENKDHTDTRLNGDEIIKDMLLNIISVEIDEINLGDMLYTHGTFVGDDTTRPVLERCLHLGWNGTWTLPFNSPFYIWLLENI